MNKEQSPIKPLISIIIPTYNCSNTLEAAINSVLDQTLEDRELIIIDGGSTDGTLDLLRKFEDKIGHWISEPDNGIYDALNKGISLANGEWLYFLGSDDRVHNPRVFAELPLRTTNSKMIYGNVLLENDGVVGTSGSIYDGKFDKYKLSKKNICQQAIFYHRSLFLGAEGFSNTYPLLADWVFNMRVFSAKKSKPTYINKIIATYANEGLSNSKKDTNFARDRFELIKKHLGFKVYISLKLQRTRIYQYGIQILKDGYKRLSALNAVGRRLLKFAGKPKNKGYCPICEGSTLFIETADWLRDYYLCVRCGSIPRQRALIKTIQERYPNYRSLAIHESSPSGPASAKLKRTCSDYLPTQFFPDRKSGEIFRGFRCENLEKMTFADASFDLIITQDVLEHVLNPDQAFIEIARTLKPGGAHIFTVPLYKGQQTVVRAKEENGTIHYLEEKVFHSNPVDKDGSMVTTDWGDDLPQRIEDVSGLPTELLTFFDRSRGLDAEFLDVFISRKPSTEAEQ